MCIVLDGPKVGRYLNTYIGPLAKRLRLQKGLKQSVVAKDIGTTAGNLCRFESGGQGLSQPLLDKLTAILGTTPDELFILNSSASEIPGACIKLLSLDKDQRAKAEGYIDSLIDYNKS